MALGDRRSALTHSLSERKAKQAIIGAQDELLQTAFEMLADPCSTSAFRATFTCCLTIKRVKLPSLAPIVLPDPAQHSTPFLLSH